MKTRIKTLALSLITFGSGTIQYRLQSLNITKRLAQMLAGVALAIPAQGALTITYTGTFQHTGPDPDTLQLDGTDFTWTGIFDETATPSFTNNSNLDRFSGTISLAFVPNSTPVVISPVANTVGELDSTNDQLQLGNAGDFSYGGLDIRPSTMFLVPGFSTGAVSSTNVLTPVNSSDVASFGDWRVLDPFDSRSLAAYEVLNPNIASVIPEPSSTILLGLGALGICIFSRRRR